MTIHICISTTTNSSRRTRCIIPSSAGNIIPKLSPASIHCAPPPILDPADYLPWEFGVPSGAGSVACRVTRCRCGVYVDRSDAQLGSLVQYLDEEAHRGAQGSTKNECRRRRMPEKETDIARSIYRNGGQLLMEPLRDSDSHVLSLSLIHI